MKETPYPYLASPFHNAPGRSGPFLEGPAEFLAEERKAYCNELSTPLHVALIEFEHAEDLRELIQEAPNINAQDAEGHTPLHMLCYRESCEYAVAEMLLAAGADVNIANKAGRTPLFVCSSPQCVKLLLDAGADVLHRDVEGCTALHFLPRVKLAVPDTVLLILSRKFPINLRDGLGNTPLHVAAEHGCEETVEILLQAGADPGILNDAGKSPADLARENAHMVMGNMLHRRQNRLVQAYRRLQIGKLAFDGTPVPPTWFRRSLIMLALSVGLFLCGSMSYPERAEVPAVLGVWLLLPAVCFIVTAAQYNRIYDAVFSSEDMQKAAERSLRAQYWFLLGIKLMVGIPIALVFIGKMAGSLLH